MHALLLHREAVIGPLLGDVVIEVCGLQRVRRERRFHRHQNVREVLKLAFERPFAGRLHVVGVGKGDIGHGAGIQRRHRLGDHVLNGVLRQLDLDIGFRLEFLDRGDQRVVLGPVEALAPPDRYLFLGRRRRRRVKQPGRRQRDRKRDFPRYFPLGSHVILPFSRRFFHRLGERLDHGRGAI
ncbi:hypothetical protein GALL_510770 [mine drainage metagenome]|uniref:Uncharacterized protein n=1 Tax=mine drainage metagenome TaxID=410659 RepID=A0A1J5P6Y7_9ZZZZ